MHDSTTKLGRGVKMRSVHELFDVWVGWLIIWCNSNWEKKISNIFSSDLVLSKPYQFFDFVLKSPGTTTRYGLFSTARSRFSLSVNLLNSSCVWLGDLETLIKLHSF